MLKRVKRRYLALKMDVQGTCTSSELLETIWGSISKLYGEHGASKVSLSLIDFDDAKKLAVVRTGHSSLELVKTALACVTKIGGQPAALHVLIISGTLKSLYRKVKA